MVATCDFDSHSAGSNPAIPAILFYFSQIGSKICPWKIYMLKLINVNYFVLIVIVKNIISNCGYRLSGNGNNLLNCNNLSSSLSNRATVPSTPPKCFKEEYKVDVGGLRLYLKPTQAERLCKRCVSLAVGNIAP